MGGDFVKGPAEVLNFPLLGGDIQQSKLWISPLRGAAHLEMRSHIEIHITNLHSLHKAMLTYD